ncbi:MAG: ribosomal-processing cysteine protease Prp [Roseburia sp.]|nr:ribosomal-processing cysteine protease Prp [Roseburia sp.]
MTTVEIYKDKSGSYRGFLCMGHADYAGKFLFHREPDILCAAISMLVMNTLNSLEELAGESLAVTAREETGFIKCDIESSLQEKSVFLLDSMVFGLEKLSEEYGTRYLQVKIKEV